MPLKLKEAVTLFISVRRGLEGGLLNEIKRNSHLNVIERIHFKRQDIVPDVDPSINEGEGRIINAPVDLAGSRIRSSDENKWLYIQNVAEEPTTVRPKAVAPPHCGTKLTETCTLRLQSGGVEVKCNREWLIKCVLGLRAAESVWLRVGSPFRCHNSEQLVQRASALPWGEYLPNVNVESICIRVISRHSTVWSKHVIEEAVRQGIQSHFACNPVLKVRSAKKFGEICVSVTLNRNTCYVAVQCSSRLSPREYNFANATQQLSRLVGESAVPFWSLSKTRLQARLEASSISEGKGFRVAPVECPQQDGRDADHIKAIRREDYIQQQHILQGDKYDTADALVAGFLQTGSVFKALSSRPLQIWNPFCSNGLVTSEIVGLILQLPNFTQHNTPRALFRLLSAGNAADVYDDTIVEYLGGKKREARGVHIIASDTSLLKLSQTAEKLNKLHAFYEDLLDGMRNRTCTNFSAGDSEGSAITDQPTLYRNYRNRLPIQLSLHHAPLGVVAPLMYRPLVIAKIPSVRNRAYKERVYDTIREYKAFGHIIGSRSDWRGVFAIAKGTAFEHFSGLEWHCVAKATNSTGDVIKLLRWSGKSQKLGDPQDRLEQIHALDCL
ncbi:hypothetical protein, conserved [Babesia bigemina]|uniref:Uncharacterized protein n=1 Tax=Babesia bigemina TaxID=5866 RepID=A0A061D110_BABBI|nr:hypothetical protein, conserved [Babesia bigemina]CDR93792.1 hypothetical protein, conserved [Babesia bigemina]|eukprot:XP_012765978.1 hypothetical protein, conserved [Babesia bigemina]